MKRYNPSEIEPKWQKTWAEAKLYAAKDFDEERTKYVMLTEFPYPSGDGLHLGHVREYTLGDIIARYKRMSGYNVLYPMGYDAFGLPTENFAIKNKIAPQVATDQNVSNFQKQFESLGYSVDWDRSFRTSDPDYYKWTQWLFLQFFNAGLAYQKEIDINWCPKCKTGLANEEVVNGKHERCDTPVEKKTLTQWLLKITEYADRLIDGLETVDYPSRIADQQINWIGRSKGATIKFKVESKKSEEIEVFTTRPDTLFGATFMVLAPEHDLITGITANDQREAVEAYVKEAARKSEIDRMDTDREKTGVFTGAYAINPANDEKIPIWVADYVLMGYGTGAIMAVPAHDQRDHEFALIFGLPITEVIEPETGEPQPNPEFRTSIVAIIWNPKNQEVLTINWGKNGGHLFVGGGREEGEDIVEAAMREIREETGYKNLRLVKKTGKIHHHYFAHSKNMSRRIEAHGLLFDLEDSARDEPELEADEKDKFKVEWIHEGQVENKVTDALHARVWDDVVRGRMYTGEGIMTNSGKYDGQKSSEVREKIVADLVEEGIAKERASYRLRDWIFSRQHYWGEPIPIVHCEKDGTVPVPEDQLPVELPPVEQYEPTDTGESPLAVVDEWVNTTCPKCGGPAKRETDTMPNWAGSSWYYLRYFDAKNDQAFADRKKLDYWGAVDMYLGGMEHTTLHLLYSRFWHQFFYDQGLVPTPEPYHARRGQGIVLAPDGRKMSKSLGNVTNPTDIIEAGYGADSLRVAITFIAPYDQTTPWNPEGVAGTYRFLNRVWTITQEYLSEVDSNQLSVVGEDNGQQAADNRLLQVTHRTIKKVSDDLHNMGFNTAVSALMEMTNGLYKVKAEKGFVDKDSWQFAIESLVKLTAPFAPHMADELWAQLGNETSVHISDWPAWDNEYLVTDTVTIAIQVNGKVRAELSVAPDAGEDEVKSAALQDENVKQHIDGKDIKRAIYVPGRLINLVV